MKKFYFFLASVLMALCANAAATQLYLIGEPAGGWNPLKGLEMNPTGEAGVFTIQVSLDGTKWFGFSEKLGANASDWGTMNGARYGATSNNAVPVVGENAMLFPSENSWKLPAGDYTFTVNTNTKKFILGGVVDDKMGDLYLRGEMNGWLNGGLDNAYKFATTDEKVYTLTVPTLVAKESFKIGTADWGYGFSSGVTEMVVDTPYSYEGVDGDMAMGESVDNATITLDLNDKTITISGEASIVVPEEDFYLVGAFNGWTLADAAYKMTKNGNVYTLSVAELVGQFKVAGKTWANSYGAEGVEGVDGEQVITIETGVPVNAWKSSSNNFNLEQAVTNATVTFTLGENGAAQLLVEGEATTVVPDALYLIGDVKDNHWDPSAAVAMEKNGSVFTLCDVEIETAFENTHGFFSFCTALGANSDDWSVGTRYGAPSLNDEIVKNVPSAFVRGENSWKVLPGKYDVKVNFESAEVTLTAGTSGVESVAAAVDEAAVYFNLQGVRVMAPEAGALYIVKRGEKVSKEIVR